MGEARVIDQLDILISNEPSIFIGFVGDNHIQNHLECGELSLDNRNRAKPAFVFLIQFYVNTEFTASIVPHTQTFDREYTTFKSELFADMGFVGHRIGVMVWFKDTKKMY
ncbi:MAG: hypothetical protein IKX03_06885 [Bacteroidales bacterium]|nr:hypothetical protein [Bacteroidales bacterium]